MKIVKLNRRWRQFKEYGHVVALRFDGWTPDASKAEKVLKELTFSGGWERSGHWYSYYGKGTDTRPYFITMRDENLVSMVLLKMSA